MTRVYGHRNIIVVDFETTGLNPQVHEIIEVGAIKVMHDLREIDRFNIKVRPEHLDVAQPRSLEVNGYNPEDWANAYSQLRAARTFSAWSADTIFCAWPIRFESRFLDAWFQKTQTENQMEYREADYHCIDIPSIAWVKLPHLKTRPSMSNLQRYFGLPEEPKPHRAIVGALCELEILRRLVRYPTPTEVMS